MARRSRAPPPKAQPISASMSCSDQKAPKPHRRWHKQPRCRAKPAAACVPSPGAHSVPTERHANRLTHEKTLESMLTNMMRLSGFMLRAFVTTLLMFHGAPLRARRAW